MKSFQDEHVLNLPDAYRKDSESNNYKILQVERTAVNELRKALRDIEHILDLDNATGITLDLYGEREGQARGQATDAQYLLMIKSKIMQNTSNGSYTSIINSLCHALNCKPSDICIEETDDCGVRITELPLDVVLNSGLTAQQAVALIKRLLPVGVKAESIDFEGTFEFGEYGEESETAGFSDESGTVGGYFGYTAGEEDEIVLPI